MLIEKCSFWYLVNSLPATPASIILCAPTPQNQARSTNCDSTIVRSVAIDVQYAGPLARNMLD